MKNMPAADIGTLSRIVEGIVQYCIQYSFHVIGALAMTLAGWILAGRIGSYVNALCLKKHMDVTLSGFLGSMAKILLIVLVIVIALSALGINISPLIAAIGAGAFGLTLAIQGPISNYGAGVAIIFTRPFVVGNTITINNYTGVVECVKLAYTIIVNSDGEHINIPNKHVVGEVITNSLANKVVERSIGIPYESDPELAIRLVKSALEQSPDVVKDPKPQAGIREFGDSAIIIGYRCWVPTRSYYEALYRVNHSVFQILKSSGISSPYPQREIRLLNPSVKP